MGSSRLQIAGRHLARLLVALELIAELLPLDDFAHSGPFNCGDVNKSILTAIIWLNEAEPFGRIEPFNCACGHDEPFQSIEKIHGTSGSADGDSDVF